MASKGLLVFTLLLAAAFLVNCARQEPQPNEGPAVDDPNASAGGNNGTSSGYGKASGHRPQAKFVGGGGGCCCNGCSGAGCSEQCAECPPPHPSPCCCRGCSSSAGKYPPSPPCERPPCGSGCCCSGCGGGCCGGKCPPPPSPPCEHPPCEEGCTYNCCNDRCCEHGESSRP